MSALTKKERDGLEDVFLSIHSERDRGEKIKEISTLLFSSDIAVTLSKLLKQVKYGLKETKTTHLFYKTVKKKKNLSK